ncbi:MAG: FCD domain-containing protein [Deltaproteobacteria bacterium]|nr:FCD domain-containing protein [Deltaproteobacteria bacterium]
METRLPLESFAGELACKRITPDQMKDLTIQFEAIQKLEYKTGAEYSFASLELKFHTSVYTATQIPELAKLLEQLHDKC